MWEKYVTLHTENQCAIFWTMSTVKTRSLLIDVARKLFAQRGLSGTTMKSSQTEAFKRKSDRANRMDDEDSKFGTVTRTPVDAQFLSGEDAQLADGVYFVGIMTSHHDEIQTSGEGTMNFFSNGFVERAVIYVGDEAAAQGLEEGVVYTITVNPLTGQSSVVPGKTEISSSFFEEEEDD